MLTVFYNQRFNYHLNILREMQENIRPPFAQGSSDFQVLSSEDQQQPKDRQEVKTASSLHQPQRRSSANQNLLKMSVVVEDETYVVLEPVEDLACTEQQWRQLIQKKRKQVLSTVQAEDNQLTKGSHFSRLTFRERHTIINIPFQDVQKRLELWSIANYTPNIQQQYRLATSLTQEDRQSLRSIVQRELPRHQLAALKKGMAKIQKLFKSIIENGICRANKPSMLSEEWKVYLLKLQHAEREIIKWIGSTLERCALEYKQVRYCKGLEYICLGIIFSYPQIDYAKYSQLFDHFMRHNQFEELFMESSPRYYSELHKIFLALREENPDLFTQIQQRDGDLKNLFVSYFRSCLLYRVTNPEVIRKIFQLLLIEGIPAMKTIVVRAMNELSPFLLQTKQFLETVASFLLVQYFRQCSQDEDVSILLQQLFQI